MKITLTLLFLCCLQAVSSQEFRYYINGANVESTTYKNLVPGDLLRVVFKAPNTNFRLKIASVQITLVPDSTSTSTDNPVQAVTTFTVDNVSRQFSDSPSFTFDLLERITALHHRFSAIRIKAINLLSETPEGEAWITENVVYREVILKMLPTK